MAGDLWNFRDDLGHDRADLTGMIVEAATDPGYRDAIARHHGA